jgi:proteasome activator subunit 4
MNSIYSINAILGAQSLWLTGSWIFLWTSKRIQHLPVGIRSLIFRIQELMLHSVTKGILAVEILVECFGTRFRRLVDHYVNLMFDNLGTSYAEACIYHRLLGYLSDIVQLRVHVVQLISSSISHQWRPSYASASAFLKACQESSDPLRIRQVIFG